jgi:hypothetical protein
VYQNDNRIDSNHNAVRDGTDTGWGMFIKVNCSTASPFDAADENASAFAFPATGTVDPDTAYQRTLASGGTLPWNRNETDAPGGR